MTETPLITPDSVPTRQMDVRARRYRGTLYVAVEDRTVELQEVAEQAFRRVDGRASVREIATAIAALYDAPPQEVLADCLELLAQLVAHGVVGMPSPN